MGLIIDSFGNVITLTDEGYLYAIDTNGEVAWSIDISGSDASPVSPPTLADNGVIYLTVSFAGTFDHRLYAVDSFTQTLIWSAEIPSYSYSSPVVDVDGNIYVHTIEGQVLSFSPLAQQRWIASTGQFLDSHLTLSVDQSTLFASGSDTLIAVSTFDGSLRWTSQVDGVRQTVTCPVLTMSDDCVIYLSHASGDGVVVVNCLSPESGVARWQTPIVVDPQYLHVCTPVVNENFIVVVTSKTLPGWSNNITTLGYNGSILFESYLPASTGYLDPILTPDNQLIVTISGNNAIPYTVIQCPIISSLNSSCSGLVPGDDSFYSGNLAVDFCGTLFAVSSAGDLFAWGGANQSCLSSGNTSSSSTTSITSPPPGSVPARYYAYLSHGDDDGDDNYHVNGYTIITRSKLCVQGSFWVAAGNGSHAHCSPCPAGLITPTTGAASNNACSIQCIAPSHYGTLRGVDGIWTSVCDDCPPASFSTVNASTWCGSCLLEVEAYPAQTDRETWNLLCPTTGVQRGAPWPASGVSGMRHCFF